MRLYTFTNCYISSIQAGIQSLHVAGELHNNVYDLLVLPEQAKMIRDWSLNHKTVIVCNGGNSASLKEYVELFSHSKYPWATFNEDEESMEGMMTAVGIILPEEIYDAEYNDCCEDQRYYYYNGICYFEDSYEYNLIKKVQSAPLAR